MRRSLPTGVLTSALVLTLALSACSDDDGDSGGSGSGSSRNDPPESISDLRWDVPFEDTDISVCSGIAVHGPVGDTPTVVDTASGAVIELAVEMPAEATLQPDDGWNYRARCQDTPSGAPVVLVEWQDRYVDPDDEPPTVYAGFDAAGAQLWVREGEGSTETTESGRGILGISVRESGEWTFVDTLTGAELGTSTFEGAIDLPPEPIDPERIVNFGGEVVSPAGELLGELPGQIWAPVDADRILVDTTNGTALVELSALEVVWSVEGYYFNGFAGDAVADPTTGTAVVTSVDDGPVSGLDLETGEVVWASDVEASLLGLTTIGGGVATFPAEDYDDISWVDTATGEVLATDDDRYLLANAETIVAVDDGVPAVVTVDDLR